MSEQYQGWHITVTVMADELGDTSAGGGEDYERRAYEAFRAAYKRELEQEYPGASVEVRQSNNCGIRSADEHPDIDGYTGEWGDGYEQERDNIQAVGEQVFDRGDWWPSGHRHLCIDCGAVVGYGDADTCESDTDHAFERCGKCAMLARTAPSCQ